MSDPVLEVAGVTKAYGEVEGSVVLGWYKLLFGTRQMDERASRYIRRGITKR